MPFFGFQFHPEVDHSELSELNSNNEKIIAQAKLDRDSLLKRLQIS